MDINAVINAIQDHYKSLTITSSRLYKKDHDKLRDAICGLANSFGCTGQTELRIEYFDLYKRFGQIDVVWYKNNKIVCAFEIDSSKRRGSIQKLLTIEAENLFWVYYGQRFYNIEDFLNALDPEEKIIKVFCKKRSKPDSSHTN